MNKAGADEPGSGGNDISSGSFRRSTRWFCVYSTSFGAFCGSFDVFSAANAICCRSSDISSIANNFCSRGNVICSRYFGIPADAFAFPVRETPISPDLLAFSLDVLSFLWRKCRFLSNFSRFLYWKRDFFQILLHFLWRKCAFLRILSRCLWRKWDFL